MLQTHWYTTSHFHHDLHGKGHLSYVLQRIQQQRPSLLWVRLAGPVPRVAVINVTRSALYTYVLSFRPMHSIRGLMNGLTISQHSWCKYETLGASDSKFVPCNSVVQLATNFHFQSALCECATRADHVDSKLLGRMKDCRWSAVLSNLVHCAIQVLSSGRQRSQPELKLKAFRPNLDVQVSSPQLSRFVAPAFPSTVMALHDAESFAKTCRLKGDFSWDTC